MPERKQQYDLTGLEEIARDFHKQIYAPVGHAAEAARISLVQQLNGGMRYGYSKHSYVCSTESDLYVCESTSLSLYRVCQDARRSFGSFQRASFHFRQAINLKAVSKTRGVLPREHSYPIQMAGKHFKASSSHANLLEVLGALFIS